MQLRACLLEALAGRDREEIYPLVLPASLKDYSGQEGHACTPLQAATQQHWCPSWRWNAAGLVAPAARRPGQPFPASGGCPLHLLGARAALLESQGVQTPLGTASLFQEPEQEALHPLSGPASWVVRIAAP